ncbi:MAG: UDP-N-acetylmuramyl pentapeptide phosphotransferase, partial [Pseudomonadota bacterium]
LAWVWFINLFNFMDGIDGITAAETVSICLGLSLVALLQGWELADFGLPLLLLGGLAGFWPWNRSPAKLFLGDVGSVPVGFMVGWLLLSAMEKGQWAVALILPLYYLMDSSLTLAKRLLRGERIWRAHREHFYQRAVQGGESHAKVVWLISICNLILICLSLISLSGYDVLCAFAALVIVGLILMKLNSPKTDAQR